MSKVSALSFDTCGNEKQKQAIIAWSDKVHNIIAYGGTLGVGKSFTLIYCIFMYAMKYPNTAYAIGRSELKLLRQNTKPSIEKFFRDCWKLDIEQYAVFNGKDNLYNLYNGSRIIFVQVGEMPGDKESNYDRFKSLELTCAAVEEAGESGITAAGVSALFSRCGRQYNEKYNIMPKLLMTFNPTHNFLKYQYYEPFKNGTLPSHVMFIEALMGDNKMLPPEYYDTQMRNMTEQQKQQLLFCNWSYDADPASLCSHDAIQDLFTNDHIIAEGEKYICADLAMQGRDLYVDSVRHGYVIRICNVIGKMSGKEIEMRLRLLAYEEKVTNSRIVADSDGMGNYLEGYIEGIKTFHGNASSDSVEYRNLKDRCGYKLAELINARKLKIIATPDQKLDIAKELSYLKNGGLDKDTHKKILMPKSEIIKQLGHSPNYLDNLLMHMVFLIKDDKDYYHIISEEPYVDNNFYRPDNI